LRSLFAVTLLLSAALLFLVEPMVAKMILPRLGGTPAVWNTCMVFFQAVLLAGYAYAHAAPRWLGTRRHAWFHVALLLAPLAVLPIGLAGGAPPSTANPVWWLLGLLLVSAGLPFFMLSTSGPLLQAWFAGTRHPAAKDPYFLYAASNLGSMTALLAYPVLIEPNLALGDQSRLWMAGYVALIALTAGCTLAAWRAAAPPAPPAEHDAVAADQPPATAPGVGLRLRWVALALVPSSLMLGVTTHLTTDVAPVPLLWILPLALYLLSFIIAFSRLPALVQTVFYWLLPVVIVLVFTLPGFEEWLPLWAVLLLHLVALLLICTVCHGELARARPPTRHLTEFYFWLSLGGVLGGVFNALVAPVLFDRVVEYPLAAVLVCFLVPHLRLRNGGTAASEKPVRSPLLPLFGLAVTAAWLGVLLLPDVDDVLYRDRSFFGVYRVERVARPGINELWSGSTLHGRQFTDPARRDVPLTYYHRDGPIGQVFREFSGPRAKRRVAVVGLGIGTLASYARAGQEWTFYEIDPAVVRLAHDQRYFTYLADCRRRGVRVKIVLGDARLRLEDAAGRYGLLVLDAFNSDAVPVHLLTREALRLYLARLADGGILAVHVSNRYVNLVPVTGALARDAGIIGAYQSDDGDSPTWRNASTWVVLTCRPEHLGQLLKNKAWRPLPAESAGAVWTDDYSNVFRFLE
jgi:hypothetical protein